MNTWYSAKIISAKGNNKYDIKWDNSNYQGENGKLKPYTTSTLKIGDIVKILKLCNFFFD